jgi:hypothetical protein
MWILVFIRLTSGGSGLPHPLPLGGAGAGVGVGAGVGAGAGVGVGFGAGAGVGFGAGAGVADTGIFGIAMVSTPLEGVVLGWVGSSSLIEWQPISRNAAPAMP